MINNFNKDKLSILICSYDKAIDILKLYDDYLFKSSKNIKKGFSIFYGLNFHYPKKNFFHNKQILHSNRYEWSISLIDWLSNIKNEYILLLLDDQIIKKISPKKINKIVNDMNSNDIKYAQISYATHFIRRFLNKSIIFKSKVLNSKYSINLQPSIWEKKFLIDLLIKSETPWDFEIKSSQIYNKENFKAYYYISKDIIFYEQFIERGKIYPKRFYEIFNYSCGVLKDRKELNTKRKLTSHLGYIFRIMKEFLNLLKSILKKDFFILND